MASSAQPKAVRPAPMRHAMSGNGLAKVIALGGVLAAAALRPAFAGKGSGLSCSRWCGCTHFLFASPLQPLLKDALEIVEVKSGGHSRYTIKPLEEQLPFDKVRLVLSGGPGSALMAHLQLRAATGWC